MLVLFETIVGYVLFRVLDESKLESIDDLQNEFSSSLKARKFVSFQDFYRFFDKKNTLDESPSSKSEIDDNFMKFLLSAMNNSPENQLGVADEKLAELIKESGINITSGPIVDELIRGIRTYFSYLLIGVNDEGISKSENNYSTDKVDVMIIQAIGLLDNLDKDLNTYIKRVKEWYGWHFPELSKVVTDNILYVKTASAIGIRKEPLPNLSSILPEDLETQVQDIAPISMGTDICEGDMENINALCTQVLEMSEYRTVLFEYIKQRMQAIAPNLTAVVGELTGARLIADAGSLSNLAKHP